MPGRDDVRHSTPGVKLTYDDFVLFPEDGKRHELIDREHYVTPSPSRKHRNTIDVYRLTGVAYVRALRLAAQNDMLTTPLFPNLEPALHRIFKD